MQLKLCNIYNKGTYKTTQWLTQADIEDHTKRGYTVSTCENIVRNVICYTIYAYDKDNDVYEMLEENVREEVLDKILTYYTKQLKQDKLCSRFNNEPFDWLEIERQMSDKTENIVIP